MTGHVAVQMRVNGRDSVVNDKTFGASTRLQSQCDRGRVVLAGNAHVRPRVGPSETGCTACHG